MLRTFFFSLAVISTTLANAQDAAAQTGGMTSTLVMVAVMGAFFYFMIIRPNKKRQQEHQNLMSELKKGSEVITSSGIIGKITEVSEGYFMIEIAPNVNIKFQRQAIISMIPKGTYKGDGKSQNHNNKKAKKEDHAASTEQNIVQETTAPNAIEETAVSNTAEENTAPSEAIESSDKKENNG